MINQQAAFKLQSELVPGETLQWAGMPNPAIIVHSDDWYLVPFGLFFAAFSIFWEYGALGYWGNAAKGSGPSWVMIAWGIPFIAMGQYYLWGRYFYDGWRKRRTYYAVTNRRVLVLQEGRARKTCTAYLDAIPVINREGGPTGTLWFGEKYPLFGGRGQKKRSSVFDIGDVPVFADIDDV